VKKLLVLAMALLVPGAWAQDSATMHAWRSLLDDKASAWRGWKSADLPAGWQIDGDTISKDGEVEDIITRDTFGNFELELEWKIGDASNSGVFYRGTDEFNQIYWSAPEYQLLDNVNAADNKKDNHLAGSVYDLYAAPKDAVRPANQWNQTRIVARGSHVEHWLNGKKVASYDVGSADWNAAIKASKFNPEKFPSFGKAPKGYLGIQGDHPGTLALRNIRIRELQ
jgi:3-keto-disaccharide hydrolase